MVATRTALRPFEYSGEQEIDAVTLGLFVRMRDQTRAWIERVMGEVARGEVPQGVEEINARLTRPTREANLGPYDLMDAVDQPDHVAYGSLVRLEVLAPNDSNGRVWWVLAGLRVNVTGDTAVYGFRLEEGVSAPIFRFEPPAPRGESAAFGDVMLRPLQDEPHVRVMLQSVHRRSWSRWQRREWALLESTPGTPAARAVWHHEESIDITQGGGVYGAGPWLDPDGLTVSGTSARWRGASRSICESVTRFRWAGERLVRRFRHETCYPDDGGGG